MMNIDIIEDEKEAVDIFFYYRECTSVPDLRYHFLVLKCVMVRVQYLIGALMYVWENLS